jgi:hypothetical protein
VGIIVIIFTLFKHGHVLIKMGRDGDSRIEKCVSLGRLALPGVVCVCLSAF